jgi:hypothetical protein
MNTYKRSARQKTGKGIPIQEMIALMMEAVRTSETSVNFNVTTWCYIPEDSKLDILFFEI